jgi:hypothetical protein
MHPAIMRQLAADHIREIHATADNERWVRQARRGRRRASSTRLRASASRALSEGDPRLDRRQRSAITGQLGHVLIVPPAGVPSDRDHVIQVDAQDRLQQPSLGDENLQALDPVDARQAARTTVATRSS